MYPPPVTTWGLDIAASPWLHHGMAAATLGLELLFPLALFSPRARCLPACPPRTSCTWAFACCSDRTSSVSSSCTRSGCRGSAWPPSWEGPGGLPRDPLAPDAVSAAFRSRAFRPPSRRAALTLPPRLRDCWRAMGAASLAERDELFVRDWSPSRTFAWPRALRRCPATFADPDGRRRDDDGPRAPGAARGSLPRAVTRTVYADPQARTAVFSTWPGASAGTWSGWRGRRAWKARSTPFPSGVYLTINKFKGRRAARWGSSTSRSMRPTPKPPVRRARANPVRQAAAAPRAAGLRFGLIRDQAATRCSPSRPRAAGTG